MNWTASGIVAGIIASVAGLPVGTAQAADPVRVGIISSNTGQFSDLGERVNAGIRLYMKLNGDTVAGRKVELIFRDDTGPFPDVTKRLALELIARDKIDILTGFISTPGALATVPVATEAKKPTLLIQAATSGITERSPYMARLSYTVGGMAAPMGEWAARNGLRRVYTVVADYGPGFDAEAAFTKGFTGNGGVIAGNLRAPLTSYDYAVFLERVKNEKPDAVFAFVPAGRSAIAFMKAFEDLGLSRAGIKLITTGDIVAEAGLPAVGDPALGVISTFHYSTVHESAENTAFLKAFREANGDVEVDFLTVQGYDTMDAIYQALKKTGGDTNPDKFMAAISGLKLNSPRGPITINAQTRNVDQTIYIRRVERRNGKLVNVEFDKL